MYWLRSFSLLSWLVATRAMIASAVRESSAAAGAAQRAARKKTEIRRRFAIAIPEAMYGRCLPKVQSALEGTGRKLAGVLLRWAGAGARPYVSRGLASHLDLQDFPRQPNQRCSGCSFTGLRGVDAFRPDERSVVGLHSLHTDSQGALQLMQL